MKKKLLALLMSLTLILTIFPSTMIVNAEDPEPDHYYFVDCGDPDVTTISEGDALGKYNSVTDKIFGADPVTEKCWGIVDAPQGGGMVAGGAIPGGADPQGSSETTPYTGDFGGTNTVYTNWTWSHENGGHVDGAPKESTNRYTKNQYENREEGQRWFDDSGSGDRRITYKFEVDASYSGDYYVETYCTDPWTDVSIEPYIYANKGTTNEVVLASPLAVPSNGGAKVIANNIKAVDGYITLDYIGKNDSNTKAVNVSYIIISQKREICTVTLNANEGTVNPTSIEVEKGKAIGTLPTPTRTNYDFKGWFTDITGGTQVINTKVVDNPMTLYAHWEIKKFNVTWNTGSGSLPEGFSPTMQVEYGKKIGEVINALPIPTRKDFRFMGWFTTSTGATEITLDNVVIANMTCYARWESSTYTVTLDTGGGNLPEGFLATRDVNHGEGIGELPAATRSDYIFKGWFTEQEEGIVVTEDMAVYSAMTIYARWEKVIPPNPTSPPVPAMVTGLKVSGQNTTSIKLSWAKTTGATGYEVQSFTNKTWIKVGTTENLEYTVNKLKAGTVYSFRVISTVTSVGKILNGKESATLVTATAPKKPKITLKKKSAKKAEIKWKKIAGASGYEVQVKVGKEAYKSIKTIKNSSTVKYTYSKLKKGKIYKFRIRAYIQAGTQKVFSQISNNKKAK